MAVGPDGTLYVVGGFTSIGGVAANYAASWDGSAFAAMGSGFNASASGVAVGDDGTVYAAGNFTTADGNTANYVARWNGTQWFAMGDGVNSGSAPLEVYNNVVYLGGTFDTAGGVDVADGVAVRPLLKTEDLMLIRKGFTEMAASGRYSIDVSKARELLKRMLRKVK